MQHVNKRWNLQYMNPNNINVWLQNHPSEFAQKHPAPPPQSQLIRSSQLFWWSNKAWGVLTWCVPHVELDPLFVNLKTGRVVLKHGGDITLKGGKRLELGSELWGGGALRRVQSAKSHRYNFIWLASDLQNWSRRCKMRKLTRDKCVNGLFYLISDRKCVVMVFPFIFLKFIEAHLAALTQRKCGKASARGALRIAPVFVRDRAKSGAAGTRGAQRGA